MLLFIWLSSAGFGMYVFALCDDGFKRSELFVRECIRRTLLDGAHPPSPYRTVVRAAEHALACLHNLLATNEHGTSAETTC